MRTENKLEIRNNEHTGPELELFDVFVGVGVDGYDVNELLDTGECFRFFFGDDELASQEFGFAFCCNSLRRCCEKRLQTVPALQTDSS